VSGVARYHLDFAMLAFVAEHACVVRAFAAIAEHGAAGPPFSVAFVR